MDGGGMEVGLGRVRYVRRRPVRHAGQMREEERDSCHSSLAGSRSKEKGTDTAQRRPATVPSLRWIDVTLHAASDCIHPRSLICVWHLRGHE